MEHLNRVVNDAVNGLGANKTPKALVRVGKVVGTLDEVLSKFDEDNNVAEHAGRHKVASFKKELTTVVQVLLALRKMLSATTPNGVIQHSAQL